MCGTVLCKIEILLEDMLEVRLVMVGFLSYSLFGQLEKGSDIMFLLSK